MSLLEKKLRLRMAAFARSSSYLMIVLLLIFFSHNTWSKNNQFDVTAVFMAKLLEYVVWADKHTHPKNFKPTLCILEDPQQSPVKPLLMANGVLNKYFTVSNKNHSKKCHVIFISRQSNPRLRKILAEINRNPPMLTFSASEKYAKKGVMINFYTERQKVRFEVNWKVMKAAGLNISSRILKLARIVE